MYRDTGELVHLEDLVLHDAEMDLRAPTHELTRAHAVLRARRRIAAASPGRFLSSVDGLPETGEPRAEEEGPDPPIDEDDPLAADLAALDAAVARSTKLLRESPAAAPGRELVYAEDFREEARLAAWRREVEATEGLAPTLAAAAALEAWRAIDPLERQSWLGPLLAADLLRKRGKARRHLPCLAIGLRATPRERRAGRDESLRILANLEAIAAAARAGLDEYDRLAAAQAGFARRCRNLRSNARLPALAELASPLLTAPMIAQSLHISARAAQDMAPALGLRELTGRGRFRAWGV